MEKRIEKILEEIYCTRKTKGRIDIVELANSFNIKVYATKEIEQPSFIAYDSECGCYEIYFNAKDVGTRQRFSIAHEIAHFLLHQDKIITFGVVGRKCSVSLTIQEEKDADHLAGCLLMPQNSIIDFLEENKITQEIKIDTEIVKKVANEFEVSVIAAALRLRELGYYVGYIEV